MRNGTNGKISGSGACIYYAPDHKFTLSTGNVQALHAVAAAAARVGAENEDDGALVCQRIQEAPRANAEPHILI